MATRTISNIITGDRIEVAACTGTTLATVNRWCSQRAKTGFPLPIERHDRREWYDLAAVDEWHQDQTSARREELSPVDRTGDPADLLTSREAAEVLGYRDLRNLPAELKERADDVATLPSGRVRRRWRRSTIWSFADERTGRHGGGRPTGHKPAPRTVDRNGAPDELVGAVEAARVLGYESYLSLPKTLYSQADETEVKASGRTWHLWRRTTLWQYENEG